MPRVSKRKQHLAQIAPLVVEGNKHRGGNLKKTGRFEYDKEKKFFRTSISDESSSDINLFIYYKIFIYLYNFFSLNI